MQKRRAAPPSSASGIAPPPPAPVANWNGFYLGANGGWGWTDVSAAIVPFGNASIADFGAVDLGSNARGGVFGGQLGYSWQFSPNWVLGFEGDFDGAGISGTNSVVTSQHLFLLHPVPNIDDPCRHIAADPRIDSRTVDRPRTDANHSFHTTI
jgi:opacity protein-like surface antigen